MPNFKTRHNVILQTAQLGGWVRFHSPQQVIEINAVRDVAAGLNYVEKEVNNRGWYAAGFISYEASPAFDDAFKVRQQKDMFPLLWFGLYKKPDRIAVPKASSMPRYRMTRWRPSIGFPRYKKHIDEIKEHIANGETYQVNYTLRLTSSFQGNEWEFFCDLAASQQADYPAFVDTGRYAICSASPELFFTLDKNRLVSRPMKGTVARGYTVHRDNEQSHWLASSEKNRAENIMIVDMVRNDMGRIAERASVSVPRLFECERFPTLWQMTSTVVCTTRKPVSAIMAALFPCASITGAPKISTMRIIKGLERESRGAYTGCIGYIAPIRRAQFNVAIRTAVIDKKENSASYGAGSGIVWPSEAAEEYAESLIKAAVLTRRFPAFSLLETMLWTPRTGYFLLGRHLRRLSDSASYFGFSFSLQCILRRLPGFAQSLPRLPHRVRLLLDKNGTISLEAAEIKVRKNGGCVRLKLGKQPVDSGDCFLYHKTTNRSVYEKAMARLSGCDDVLLYNERGEITETCMANIVVALDKRLITPPLDCGLLGGTMRAHLAARHSIHEGVILKRDLKRAEAIFTINSVRKWRKAIIVAD
jgi:para-aminobenzoate synthetase / 4-amino-4-deoxychorismate lyase